MFKQLIEVWKGEETLIDEIANDFQEMLRIGQDMYDDVTSALLEGKAINDLKKTLYKKDAKLNMLEQTIRRKIVSQLTALSGAEGPIASCLILMSVSKDAERIGDYVKNIYQVYDVKPQLAKEEPYYGRLLSVKTSIAELFEGVRSSFADGNQDKARALVQKSFEGQKICDENVKDLLLTNAGDDYVAYALLTRFFKRSLAHLANIATTVFMPVTKIDFFDEIRESESA